MCALNNSLGANVGSTSIIAQYGSSCQGIPLVVRILDHKFSLQGKEIQGDTRIAAAPAEWPIATT